MKHGICDYNIVRVRTLKIFSVSLNWNSENFLELIIYFQYISIKKENNAELSRSDP